MCAQCSVASLGAYMKNLASPFKWCSVFFYLHEESSHLICDYTWCCSFLEEEEEKHTKNLITFWYLLVCHWMGHLPSDAVILCVFFWLLRSCLCNENPFGYGLYFCMTSNYSTIIPFIHIFWACLLNLPNVQCVQFTLDFSCVLLMVRP